MYCEYIKQMSFKDSIIAEISDMTKTKEPLYKITFTKPKLTIYDDPTNSDSEDEDSVPIKYCVITQIRTVIFDKSTWLNTYNGSLYDTEYLDNEWKNIINMEHHSHRAQVFGFEVPSGHHLVCRKLSVELLN